MTYSVLIGRLSRARSLTNATLGHQAEHLLGQTGVVHLVELSWLEWRPGS